ncbi:MAG TPA: glycosyltransferase family 2 protein [Acidimicrobiia bacterium]|nr:glycosyltransferase family 2 protein [Acidimicrobiia bacterium]
MSTREPARVRAVVVNYNGRDLTLECVRRLRATEWPADRFEIVLVDNASSDDVVATARAEWPDVRLVESDRNLGFGGGNNLALRDLEGVDAVALVNSDVLVEPGWLAPLARALSHNPTIGAACPKMLFASQFRDVELRSGTQRRGRGDRRRLGVRVSGARVAGEDVWRDTQLVEGFWGPELGTEPESTYQWTSGRAVLRVPVTASTTAEECELRLAGDAETVVTALSAGRERELDVGTEPSWHTIPLGGRPFDVVNNVGTVPTGDGYFADRGYLERDHGQYATPESVFAWSGGAVLLAVPYLADVGLFDEALFLYYEDVDLSWRGRERGWRYRYVPDSVVRHVHSASTQAGSPRFDYYNERNRLVTLTRHADRRTVAKALAKYLLATCSYARRDVVSPVLRGQAPRPEVPLRRLRALGGYATALSRR